ncbi:MAG: hypothetical protein WA843_00740 [Candidatus Saccharimonadales bacterium]
MSGKNGALGRRLLIYSIGISLVVSFGLAKDTHLNDLATGVATPLATLLVRFLAVLLAIYLIRVGLLLMPGRVADPRWAKMTTYGVRAAFLPELIVIFLGLGLALQSGSRAACSQSSNCGWGFLIFLPIAISAGLQLIGMTIGLIVGLSQK